MIELLSNQLVFSFVLMLALIGAIMGLVAYSTLGERKVSAWIQERCGPNRVGFFGLFGNFHFWGLGQPLADGVKFLLKEDFVPAKADKPLYILAPALVFVVAMIGFAVIPWGGVVDLDGDGLWDVRCQVANPDIGLLYMLGIGAMSVYGVVLGGWASNNKYAFYGAIRAAAQMISYEVPLGLSILVIVLMSGQVRLEGILDAQMGPGNTWNILVHPLAFLILLIAQFAETNRAPFDLAECEQELVGGFHTEYGSMKFALFFLGEYTHMIVNSAFITVLFFGGWHLPFVPGLQPQDTAIWAMLFKMLVLGGKVVLFMFFYMWVRWTIPRFRFDQLMKLAWRSLVPISMGLAVAATLLVYFRVPAMGVVGKIFWGLTSNLAVVLVLMVVLALTSGRVTGRQANLPPVSLVDPAKPKPSPVRSTTA